MVDCLKSQSNERKEKNGFLIKMKTIEISLAKFRR